MTKFNKIFSLLKYYKYKGDFVLQAARLKNPIEEIIEYINFTKKYLRRYFV
jgi:hypothetical protein